jgi:hypothetical protein
MDLKAAQEAIDHITGGWRAQCLYAAVKLGIPDHIEAGCHTDAELAGATGAAEEGVHRLMRLLVAIGVFEGDGSQGYRNTPVSAVLLDTPDSLRHMCLLYGEEFYVAWGHVVHAVRTVSAGFEEAYGNPLYEYLSHHEDAAERFQRAMKAGNLFFDYVPEFFDFSGKTVVDVGGGNGSLIEAVLRATPDARGILIDQEHVVPIARDHLAATIGLDRVEVVGGSMFDVVPEGGDVYLLCRVLAGHSDDALVTVFGNCRRGMADASSRLIILERTVADEGSTVLPALWDLHLLMTNGGRHRTVELFRSLLDRAGFDIERVAELPAETTAIVAAPQG